MDNIKELMKLCDIEFDKFLRKEKNNYYSLSNKVTNARKEKGILATDYCKRAICCFCQYYDSELKSCCVRKVLLETGEWPQFIPKDIEAWNRYVVDRRDNCRKWHRKFYSKRRAS